MSVYKNTPIAVVGLPSAVEFGQSLELSEAMALESDGDETESRGGAR